jgi:hypothetical protein
MMNEIAEPEPKLAPPGAGLPALECFVGRCLLWLSRLRGNRAVFNNQFNREREVIRALVASCDAESAARRVLIPRLRGLEDSSRYWSVWMTLDHLRKVNLGFARIIGALSKGVQLPGQASTASVKPDPAVTGTVVAEYEASCDAVMAAVAGVPNLKTAVRFRHPWFGTLDALGWHVLAGNHMGLHRVQMERILAGIGESVD